MLTYSAACLLNINLLLFGHIKYERRDVGVETLELFKGTFDGSGLSKVLSYCILNSRFK